MADDIGANTTIVVGQAITLITLVVGLCAQAWRERRRRRWDMEDRAAARVQLTRTLNLKGDELAKTIAGQHEATRDAIADNTKKTEEAAGAAREAYTEANHANNKIIDTNHAISNLNNRILAIVEKDRAGT